MKKQIYWIQGALMATAVILLWVGYAQATIPARYLATAVAGTGVQAGVATEPTYPGYASTDPVLHKKSFVASVATGTATVNVEASQDNVTWFVLATFTLAAGTPQSTLSDAAWSYYRANITASSGAVTVIMYP